MDKSLFKKIFLGVFVLAFTAFLPVTEEQIRWYSFEEVEQLTAQHRKKVLVDIYTDWCGWCGIMEKKTYGNPYIARYVNRNFYAVKLNAESKKIIRFKGETFKYHSVGTKGINGLAAVLLNNNFSYPTTVFLDESLKIIQPIPGFMKPKQLEPIIKYIAGNYYKKTKWEAFKSEFKSSL